MRTTLASLAAFTLLSGGAALADPAIIFDGAKNSLVNSSIVPDPDNSANLTGRWNPKAGGGWGMNITPELKDWSNFDTVSFRMYSAKADNHEMMFSIASDPEDSKGNYYFKRIKLDWTGWKSFSFPFASLGKSRNPIGWNKIDMITFNFKGWGMTPNPDAVYHIDDITVSAAADKSGDSSKKN